MNSEKEGKGELNTQLKKKFRKLAISILVPILPFLLIGFLFFVVIMAIAPIFMGNGLASASETGTGDYEYKDLDSTDGCDSFSWFKFGINDVCELNNYIRDKIKEYEGKPTRDGGVLRMDKALIYSTIIYKYANQKDVEFEPRAILEDITKKGKVGRGDIDKIFEAMVTKQTETIEYEENGETKTREVTYFFVDTAKYKKFLLLDQNSLDGPIPLVSYTIPENSVKALKDSSTVTELSKRYGEIYNIKADIIEKLYNEGKGLNSSRTYTNMEQKIIQIAKTLKDTPGAVGYTADQIKEGDYQLPAGFDPNKEVMYYCDVFDMDYVLILAIMYHESGRFTSNAYMNYNNPAGNMTSSGLMRFDNKIQGILFTIMNLKYYYIAEGRITPETIQPKYCPIGAANDPNNLNVNWISGVKSIMNEISGGKYTAPLEDLSGVVAGNGYIATFDYVKAIEDGEEKSNKIKQIYQDIIGYSEYLNGYFKEEAPDDFLVDGSGAKIGGAGQNMDPLPTDLATASKDPFTTPSMTNPTNLTQTSCFGNYDSSFRGGKAHYGVDVASASADVKIYPIADGVVYAYNMNACNGYRASSGTCTSCPGTYITIKHEINGKVYFSTYRHLEAGSIPANFRVDISSNTPVTKNDYIGIMGNTGCSSGRHLHLEIVDGESKKYLNPQQLIDTLAGSRPSCP